MAQKSLVVIADLLKNSSNVLVRTVSTTRTVYTQTFEEIVGIFRFGCT